MSVQAISWAMAQRTGSGTRKAVLVALANCHNHHTAKCCPKVATIATETELHDRTVRRALTELEEEGFILRIETRRADGSQGPSRYMLRMDRESEQTDTDAGGQTGTAPHQEPEVNLEPSVSTYVLTADEDKSDFDLLWDACEIHVQRAPSAKSARAAYAKIVREMYRASWSPLDVEVRAAAYKRHETLGGTMLTLAALAKWGETFTIPAAPRIVEREPEPEGPWAPPPQWPVLKDMPA